MLKQLFDRGIKTAQTPSTLAQLGISQRAKVVGVDGQGKSAQRLYEMGLVEGAEVTLVRRAPMGARRTRVTSAPSTSPIS